VCSSCHTIRHTHTLPNAIKYPVAHRHADTNTYVHCDTDDNADGDAVSVDDSDSNRDRHGVTVVFGICDGIVIAQQLTRSDGNADVYEFAYIIAISIIDVVGVNYAYGDTYTNSHSNAICLRF